MGLEPHPRPIDPPPQPAWPAEYHLIGLPRPDLQKCQPQARRSCPHPDIAFHIDGKGFVRQAVGGDSPEFTDPTTGHTTNTSGGIIGQAGVVFYF